MAEPLQSPLHIPGIAAGGPDTGVGRIMRKFGDTDGRPDFSAITKDHANLCIWFFDLLAKADQDMREKPLVGRKAALRDLLIVVDNDRLRYSEEFADPVKLLHVAARMGLEGIVSKRKHAPYRSWTRREWVKVKTAVWREANKDRWEGALACATSARYSHCIAHCEIKRRARRSRATCTFWSGLTWADGSVIQRLRFSGRQRIPNSDRTARSIRQGVLNKARVAEGAATLAPHCRETDNESGGRQRGIAAHRIELHGGEKLGAIFRSKNFSLKRQSK
jgi:hypothetical protein